MQAFNHQGLPVVHPVAAFMEGEMQDGTRVLIAEAAELSEGNTKPLFGSTARNFREMSTMGFTVYDMHLDRTLQYAIDKIDYDNEGDIVSWEMRCIDDSLIAFARRTLPLPIIIYND